MKGKFVERFNQEYENWVKSSNNGRHSQNEFSKYLGLANKSVVQRYLSDNTQSVQVDDLFLISNKLNVSVDYLLGLSDIEKPFVENDNGIALLIGQYMRELADVSSKVDRLKCTPINLVESKVIDVISDINSIYFKLKKIRDGEN